jgi:hypothetical protein
LSDENGREGVVVIEELVIVVIDEGGEETGEAKVQFHVSDNNNGDEYKLKARLHATIQHVVDRFYQELGRDRLAGDRLTRASDDSNVFDSLSETVKQYIGDKKPHERVLWNFVGETGGA